MENIKELINSFNKKDYWETVNLHTHSTYSDGKSTPEELVEQAKKSGIKHLAIADHNTLNAYKETNIKDESIIIPAIEFDSWYGYVFLHLLGYGIDTNSKEIEKFCAKTKKGTEADIVRIFSFNKHPKKLIEAIHKAGGIAVLAHPACCWALSLDRLVKNLKNLGLDGIECYYPYNRHRGIIKFHKNSTAEYLAEKYNLIKTGGTDEHGILTAKKYSN